MAKIAGRKNDSAWQGANNWLERAAPAVIAALEADLEAKPEVIAAYAIIKSTYAAQGIPLPDALASITSWVATMTNGGFPRDVWFGQCAYDFYNKMLNPLTGQWEYLKIITPLLSKAAAVIRFVVKVYQFADRQAGWLAQDTHPPVTARAARAAILADPVGYRLARRAQIDLARTKLPADFRGTPLPQLSRPKKPLDTPRAKK